MRNSRRAATDRRHIESIAEPQPAPSEDFQFHVQTFYCDFSSSACLVLTKFSEKAAAIVEANNSRRPVTNTRAPAAVLRSVSRCFVDCKKLLLLSFARCVRCSPRSCAPCPNNCHSRGTAGHTQSLSPKRCHQRLCCLSGARLRAVLGSIAVSCATGLQRWLCGRLLLMGSIPSLGQWRPHSSPLEFTGDCEEGRKEQRPAVDTTAKQQRTHPPTLPLWKSGWGRGICFTWAHKVAPSTPPSWGRRPTPP